MQDTDEKKSSRTDHLLRRGRERNLTQIKATTPSLLDFSIAVHLRYVLFMMRIKFYLQIESFEGTSQEMGNYLRGL